MVFWLMVATAPVKSLALAVPYPTTTTSVNDLFSETKLTFTIDLLPTETSCVIKPTKLNANTALSSDTFTLYVPSLALLTPLLVPLIRILTPGIGFPLSSVIFPFTGLFSAIRSSISDLKNGVLVFVASMLLLVNKILFSITSYVINLGFNISLKTAESFTFCKFKFNF